MTGPFEDRRQWWPVFVTGHPAAIAAGPWMHSVIGRESFERPGAAEVRAYLDAVLYVRRETCRVHVYCRGTRGRDAGIDATVRAYCAARGLPCLPVFGDPETHGTEADYRRDLELIARCRAVVWFGPTCALCPATLAVILGVPCRTVPLFEEVHRVQDEAGPQEEVEAPAEAAAGAAGHGHGLRGRAP